MTLFAITGTPGTGKTSVSAELRSRGYDVIDMNEHIRANGLLGELDSKRDTHEVDLDDLNDSLQRYRDDGSLHLMDSHLSHFMDCSGIIVLRCSPEVLYKRLEARGYGKEKILENVQSEVLDVILCEAVDSDIPVYEVDCSGGNVADSADSIEEILKGCTDNYIPGKTDWSQEMERWF
ncbi:MAG: AMP kinase [Thermoplasmata archaeon]|jgi:adenylate kinase|nr:AMP kinase [Thermoplasmata archaeon]